MKKLFILLLIGATMQAQKPPAHSNLQNALNSEPQPTIGSLNGMTYGGFSISYGGSPEYLMVREDGSLEITGDTLTALKMVVKEMEKMSKDAMELQETLDDGVIWSNTVSDYFKQSKKWKTYQKALHRRGYKTTKKK